MVRHGPRTNRRRGVKPPVRPQLFRADHHDHLPALKTRHAFDLPGLADVTGTNPIAVTMAGALGSSFGFMMPISTAPNAMAFGTGQVTMRQMVTTGFVFDLVGVVVVVAGVMVLCG